MRDGFIKVAAGTPRIKVADCDHNAGQIIALMEEAAAQGVKVLALPSCASPATPAEIYFCRTRCLTGRKKPSNIFLKKVKKPTWLRLSALR